MFCRYCGKSNPIKSNFCQHCGKKLSVPQKKVSNTVAINTMMEEKSYPYIISPTKLVLLYTATFGIYQLVWFYKHFKSFKLETDWKINPLIRTILSDIVAFSLFKRVSKSIEALDESKKLRYGALSLAFALLMALGALPSYWGALGLLSVLPLIPVQKAINYYWETKYKATIVPSNLTKKNILFSILGFLIIGICTISYYLIDTYLLKEEPKESTKIEVSLDSSSEDTLLQAINKTRVSNNVNELTKNVWVCEIAKLRLKDVLDIGLDTFDSTAALQRAIDHASEDLAESDTTDIEPVYFMETFTYQETIEDSIEEWTSPDNDLLTNEEYEYGCTAIGNGYGIVITGHGDMEKEKAEYELQNSDSTDETPLMKI